MTPQDRAFWNGRHRTDLLDLRRKVSERAAEELFWKDEIKGGDLIFEFELAEQMCCTVAELRTRLSEAEFQQWRGFKNYSAKKQIDAYKKATAEAEKGG